ncbi:MAG: hypothetical protein GDA43_16975 [Hormoscilla sp. SP5CHS1]|nr:hypothetical protein [Hormoscilla sp. SP12CHS1]MBC6454683.1 hypothetical protein [Hormoscilla sp. SP5CHS1]
MDTLIDRSRLVYKIGNYATGLANALKDPMLHPKVQMFRRKMAATMRPLDKSDISQKIPTDNYHISRKIDGEFTVLLFDGESAITVNPGGTVRTGLDFMAEAASLLKKAGIKQAAIAGELYVQPDEDKTRPRVRDLMVIARKPENESEVKRLKFAAFDIVECDQKTYPVYADSWNAIAAIFGKGKNIHPVETVIGEKPAQIQEYFEQWVESEGAEGVVARGKSSGIFKIKPRHNIDAIVLGFTEGTDDRIGMLHDVLVGIMRKDETFQLLTHVGGGFTDKMRRNLLSDLKDIVVDSEYSEINSDRVAYRMVEPKYIIEISCLDLMAETTRQGTIDKMVLNWNASQKRYEVIRRMPLVNAISPQFVKFREDKSVNPEDLRIEQITDLVEVPLADRSAKAYKLPESTLLKRRVATKTLKGAEMVRKLVMWKTNKESSDEYPAYVLHFTDFSPNRKDPLSREIRVSNSEEQIEALWLEMEKKNFVRGWKVID